MPFKAIAMSILCKHGIKRLNRNIWHPRENWLNALGEISSKLTSSSLYSMGAIISGKTKLPSKIDDLDKALAAIDVLYHLNHMRNGKPLFDLATGSMAGGIGHYHYEMLNAGNNAKIICSTPYPCDFDKGIVVGLARRFRNEQAAIEIHHEEKYACRKKGSSFCEYFIKW